MEILTSTAVVAALAALGGAALDRLWSVYSESKLREVLKEVKEKFGELEAMAEGGFNEAEVNKIVSYVRGLLARVF